jgi:hypothetical protein
MSKSSDTKPKNSATNDSRKHQSSASKNGGAESSSAREFIYLDVPKLASYLSQIQSGLSLLVKRVEKAFESTEGKDASDSDTVGSNVRARVAAGLGPIGKASVDFGLSRERTTTPYSEASREGMETSSTDLGVLHHAMFDIVMEKLEFQFFTVTGTALIMPVGAIIRAVDQFATPEIRQVAEVITNLNIDAVAYIENDRAVAHAFLLNEHFTAPPTYLYSTYGAPSQIDFTIVGLYAMDPRKTGSRIMQLSGSDFGRMAKGLNEAFENIHKMMGTNRGTRLYPLAIYRSLSRQ